MTIRRSPAGPRRGQRGVGLIETLVGMAIGLFVTAAALAVSTRLAQEQRRLVAEARLQQDLRAAVDVVARGLRRAAYWSALSGGPTGGYAANPTDRFTTAEGPAVGYAHTHVDPARVDIAEVGFRLRSGVLQFRTGDSGWQALTDPNLMRVQALSLQPQSIALPLELRCGDDDCRPGAPPCARVVRRTVAIRATASAAGDPALQRTIETTVMLRNDSLQGVAC